MGHVCQHCNYSLADNVPPLVPFGLPRADGVDGVPLRALLEVGLPLAGLEAPMIIGCLRSNALRRRGVLVNPELQAVGHARQWGYVGVCGGAHAVVTMLVNGPSHHSLNS
jgi:hypothetical protein